MLDLIDYAKDAGIDDFCVLFDSWFSSPAQAAVLEKGCDVVCMVKKHMTK